MTLWDGIVGIFLWASQSIEPVLDGLFSAVGLGPVREGVKTAIGAVPDWLKTAFTDAWSVIPPIIDTPKWLRDKGKALASVTGANKGPISSGYDPSSDPGGGGLMLPPGPAIRPGRQLLARPDHGRRTWPGTAL